MAITRDLFESLGGGELLADAAKGSLGAAGKHLADTAQQSITIEHDLKIAANVAGLDPREADAKISEWKAKLITLSKKTNQTQDELRGAFLALVKDGVTPDAALNGLESAGNAAKASGADLIKLSSSLQGTNDALKITPALASKATDSLMAISKGGGIKFEKLTEILPEAAESGAKLGITGTAGLASLGAAAQIANQAGASPEEAGKLMDDFFSKLSDPAFAKQHNIDLDKEKAAAQKSGDPLLYMAQLAQRLAKNDPAKLSGMFGSEIAQKVIMPLNDATALKQYQETRAAGMAANGVTARDKEAVLNSTAELAKGRQIETEANAQSSWAGGLHGAFDTALKGLNKVGIDDTVVLGIGAALTTGFALWNHKRNKSGAGSGGSPSLPGSSGGSGIRVFVTNWPGQGRGGGIDLPDRRRRPGSGPSRPGSNRTGRLSRMTRLAERGKSWLGRQGTGLRGIATRGSQVLRNGMQLGKGLLGTGAQALRAAPNLAMSALRALPGLSLRALPALGGGAMAAAAAGIATAGMAGYAVGGLINKHLIEGTKAGDAIGEGIAHVLAFFGNDDAREALRLNGDQAPQPPASQRPLTETEKRTIAALPAGSQSPQKVSGQIEVKIHLPASLTGTTTTVTQPAGQGVTVQPKVGTYLTGPG
ncbi:phage tail tape measure protein [Jeongeupia wiesaeckerbachi]|uniref:phage tail tape measure protein n=1 Tax=Jeongeupia wiesaeckerbachi TaxID=3051218 RepID=UPI003D802FC2